MTSTEFNKKYEAYLEPGFYGLEFDFPAVTEMLDKEFQEFIKLPGFQYSQIKLKFGMARFYTTLTSAEEDRVEKQINTLIKQKDQ